MRLSKTILMFTLLIMISQLTLCSVHCFADTTEFEELEQMDKRIKQSQKFMEGTTYDDELSSRAESILMLVGALALGFFLFKPLMGLIKKFIRFFKFRLPPNVAIPDDVPADIGKLIKWLHSSYEEKRWEAAYELGRKGPRAAPAIPYLLEMLKKKYADAGRVMIKKDVPKESPSLIRYAVAPIGSTLKAINKADSQFKYEENLKTLPVVSVVVTSALAGIGEPAVEALTSLLEDGDKYDKKAAADALKSLVRRDA